MIEKIKQYKKELLLFVLVFAVTFSICCIVYNAFLKKTDTEGANVEQSVSYVGSKNSDKYHMPSCKWAKNIKSSNKITFSSEEQAKSKGYSACKTCKP